MTSFAPARLLSALAPAGHAQAGGCPSASGAAPYARIFSALTVSKFMEWS